MAEALPRGFRAPPVKILLAVAIGGAGGAPAYSLQLPLAWMIGSMTAATCAAAMGAPVALPMGYRTIMVAVLGVFLGSGFSPEILEQMADWILSLAAVALYAAAAGAVGMAYFRRVCGYDPVTAYFSAMPGGLSEMVLVGEESGGDTRIISLIHASRVLLVVLALPFAFQLLLGYEPGNRPPPGPALGAVAPLDALVLLFCGLTGFMAAKALKIPAAAIVGPMVFSAAVHLSGWSDAKPPFVLIAMAQIVVGTAIGCRFAGVKAGLIGRTLVAAVGGTAALLGVTLLLAFLLQVATGLPLATLILAFAPGGLAEMSLIAIALSYDAAFVALHHILRIAIIVTCAPLAFRLLGVRNAAAPKL